MKKLTMLAAASVLAFTGVLLEAQTGYVLVVNDANATSSIAKADVAKLFLKKTTKWGSGLKVQPVDQAPARSVRESFTKSVHGKSVFAVKAYWQKMIFSGKATPPPELDSDSKILDYVSGNSGAIGYVSSSASLVDGVKKLRVTG